MSYKEAVAHATNHILQHRLRADFDPLPIVFGGDDIVERRDRFIVNLIEVHRMVDVFRYNIANTGTDASGS